MKIKRVRVEDFKRIRFAEIQPDRAVFVIGGNNGQGKSSLIDAIIAGLGGQKAMPAVPVRRGAKKAKTTIELDDFTIKQSITDQGTYKLVVERPDGIRYSNGQTVLDRFYSKLSFDPLAFLRMKPKDQAEALRAALGLDFAALDSKRQELYETRTDYNREVRSLGSRREELTSFPDAPKERVDVSAIATELSAAKDHNAKIATASADIQREEAELAALDQRIADMKERLAQTEALRKQKSDALATLAKSAKKAKPVDTSALEDQIRNAQAINNQVDANAEYARVQRDFMAAKTKADELTKAIEDIDEQKAKAVSGAAFPVPGLSFGEDGIELNGLPFDQASGAEALRVSFEVAFADAKKRGLSVVISKEGSLLDEDSLALLTAATEAHGMQVILERVGNEGLVIEDGIVQGQKQPGDDENFLDDEEEGGE